MSLVVTLKLPVKASNELRAIRTDGATHRKIELAMEKMRFPINGLSFRMSEIAFDVKQGAVEIRSTSNRVAA